MTTNKGISIAAVSGIMGTALVFALAAAPANTAQADGMPGLADAAVVYSDGYMSMLDLVVAPGLAGTEAIIHADGMPVFGMWLSPGSNPVPLPAAASYVVTGVGTGDIAWAAVGNGWDPGSE